MKLLRCNYFLSILLKRNPSGCYTVKQLSVVINYLLQLKFSNWIRYQSYLAKLAHHSHLKRQSTRVNEVNRSMSSTAISWQHLKFDQETKIAKSRENVKRVHSSSWEPISELRSVTCRMGSHNVTSHRTQVNAPRLNPGQPGRYSIYSGWIEGWVDLSGCLHTKMVYLPADSRPNSNRWSRTTG